MKHRPVIEPPLTPGAIAKKLGVHIRKIHGWIEAGELAAINVASTTSIRPRWIVLPEALAEFERRRSALPKVEQEKPSRKLPKGFVKYI